MQLEDLTSSVARARRGFRSDVVPLAQGLSKGALLVPLARSISGVPVGEDQELDELSVAPHMIHDAETGYYVPLFTRIEILELASQHLGWKTSGGPLEICTLPGNAAADLALELLLDEKVVGIVINPGDEAELLLRRSELASIAQGRALPLVGYVAQIPLGENEKSLVCELEGPLPEALVQEVESTLSAFPGVRGYRIEQTFNAERDVEPHLTLTLQVSEGDLDTDALGEALLSRLEGKLPEPGYVDVLFEPTGGAGGGSL